MGIRLIASDLDGTLLRDAKTLSERNREAMEHAIAQGIHFVPATGRTFHAVPQEIREFPGIEYVIITNGAAIYSLSRKRRIYSCILTEEAVEALLRIPQDPEVVLEAYVDGVPYGEARYVDNPRRFGATEYGAEYVRNTRRPVEKIRDFIRENRMRMDSVSFICGKKEIRDRLRERILREVPDIYLTSSIEHLLEIGHKDAGKGRTLQYLLKLLDISPDEAMAFGDADNDTEMLACVKYGIAMENASESCRQAAYAVTSSNEEDGVGVMMEKYIYNRVI